MSTYKQERNAEDIKREITAVIRELKDPRIADGILTVVRVEIAHDLSYCKVYVSSINGIEDAAAAVKVLEKAKGLIRHEVGSRLSLRKTPDMKFIADDSVQKGIEMFEKLDAEEKSGANND